MRLTWEQVSLILYCYLIFLFKSEYLFFFPWLLNEHTLQYKQKNTRSDYEGGVKMKKIFMILVMIGTVMLFGTAGASDVGNITVGRACMQGIASVGFLFSGMLGMLLCRMDEIRMRRNRRYREAKRRVSTKETYVYIER